MPLRQFDGYPEDDFVGAVTPWDDTTSATATGRKVPAGVEPLDRDIFTSKDFYADRDLCMDKRYYDVPRSGPTGALACLGWHSPGQPVRE